MLTAVVLLLPGTILSQQLVRGERPFIDLSRIPANAYETGKLNIKFKPSAAAFLQYHLPDENGIARFGNTGVDQLNRQFEVKKTKKVFENIVADKKFEPRHVASGLPLWYQLDLPLNTNIIEAAKAYAALDIIEVAEPCYKKTLYDHFNWSPADPQYLNQWHYNNTGQQGGTVDADIDLPEAWDIQKGNPNVIVAVVDGGVDTSHPDLRQNLWIGSDFRYGYNFVTNSGKLSPDDHGCHVAGTIAAVNNNSIGVSGIAGGNGTTTSGARIMSCQVFSNNGTALSFASAYIFSADHGAAISQNSWGYTVAGTYEQSVLDAIDYFIQYGGGNVMGGGLVIFSAGNNNAYQRDYPGAYNRVICVTATNNMDQRAWYSTYGQWADISAPGGETNSVNTRGILSTISVASGSYGWFQGTSMACPHVSGVAALIISQAPGRLTNDDVKSILLTTSDNHYLVNSGYLDQLGTGRVNAYNALLKTNQILSNSSVDTVGNFIANAPDCNTVNLSWTKNSAGNDVMIAVATDKNNLFGIPTGGYSIGDNIAGGGKIIYKGSSAGFTWSTTLLDSVYYYFKIWSVTATNKFSAGKSNFIAKNTNQSPIQSLVAANNDCEVDLAWTRSGTCAAPEVIIAVNSTPVFGCPSGSLIPGNSIGGGGTVIYRGSATSFNHTGLGDSTNSYYAIWASSVSAYSVIPKIIFGSSNAYVRSFTATLGTNSGEISLEWTKSSCFGGNVMVAYTVSGSCGDPSGTYIPGNNIAGGGTVIYVGPLLNFVHAGVTGATTYTYQIWPIISPGVYGISKTTTVSTPCGNGTLALPITDNFNSASYNACLWDTVFVTQASGVNRPQISIVSTGDYPVVNPADGSSMIKFNSYDCNYGAQMRLESKPVNTNGNSVDIIYRWYHDNSAFTGTAYAGEGVKLQWSANGTTWNTFDSADRLPPSVANESGWKFKQSTLPAIALNNPQIRIAFLFTSKYGNNCYMDSIGIFTTKIKPTDGATRTAVSEFTDASGWTHYNDSEGERLLSIKKNGNNIGFVNQPGFNLIVAGNNGFSSIANTGNNYVTNGGGWKTMNRYYDLTPVSEPATDCNIRFYYSTSDSMNLKDAALTLNPPMGTIANAVFTVYKINKISAQYDIDPINGHVNIPRASAYNLNGFWQYGIGTAPSSTNWVFGNMGSSMRYAEYVVKHFGGGGIGIGGAGQGALPLKWLRFTASLVNHNTAALQWKVSEETFLKSYEVELSRDATSFTKTVSLSPLPVSATNTYDYNYLLTDQGNYFFRIKQTDLDGKYSYSIVARLFFGRDGSIIIAPNPAKEYFQVLTNERINKVELSDASGKLVRSFSPVSNNIYSLVGVAKGLYVVKLSVGEQVKVYKLMAE